MFLKKLFSKSLLGRFISGLSLLLSLLGVLKSKPLGNEVGGGFGSKMPPSLILGALRVGVFVKGTLSACGEKPIVGSDLLG